MNMQFESLLDDLKRVSGKQNLLFELADATLAQPDGVVRDVVFPVIGEQILRDLVKEWKATGATYRVRKPSSRRFYARSVQLLCKVHEKRKHQRESDAPEHLQGDICLLHFTF